MIPKFRAWDKFDKEMLNVHGINYDTEGVWTKEMIDDESDGGFIYFSDIELLQSTGLFDKNGKEIFESYVVKVHAFFFDGCSESEKEHIGIIRYGNIAGFLIKEWYLETVDNKIAFLDLELHEESFEILGNEFEHPHLLGED
ncbi:YopX family protein [Mammaliicoccus sciuri]|uniref:YopX family protein n=1 Tax=Mammaliicoccus sciuri TaxID=1296 RepID=UPI002885ACDE|nr:YopX family protein [Mammaliicoccus sciuri]MDT0703928.1 YopX family protein [Mammaliicoccus sciuri]